jgi:dipeptidyl aminopeptidase/acylaminoacyl peptidase
MKLAFVLAVSLIAVDASQEPKTPVDAPDLEANGPSGAPSISEDGDIVVFESKASNLVSDDTDDEWDVFAHSRKEHRTWRVSGKEAVSARKPAISGDGRWVAYLRLRIGERPSVGRALWSVVLHDLRTGKSTSIDARTGGWGSDYPPRAPQLSRDGHWLVYVSQNEKPDSVAQAYLFDRESGATEVISSSSNGEMCDRDVSEPAISSDGRFVVYCTDSDRVALPKSPLPADSAFDFLHDRQHVFVRDRQTHTTRYASDVALKQLGYADYHDPRISDDGRYVVYNHHDSRMSFAEHIGFVSDLLESRPGRLLEPESGKWFQGAMVITWLSADGRRVLVATSSPLAPLPPNNTEVQLYECDLEHKTWTLLSRSPLAPAGNLSTHEGVASRDASIIAFSSNASNLVSGDTNREPDIFVLDKSTGHVERISVAAAK